MKISKKTILIIIIIILLFSFYRWKYSFINLATSYLGHYETDFIFPLILSPDQTKLVFNVYWSKTLFRRSLGSSDTYVMNVDGTGVKKLTNQAMRLIEDSGDAGWSPDSKQIIYILETSLRNPEGIWVTDIDNSEQRIIFKKLKMTTLDNPCISPNNNQVAFSIHYIDRQVANSRKLGLHDSELWIIKLDGTNEKLLASPVNDAYQGLKWSLDGKNIFFLCKKNIWVIGIDRTQEKQLTKGFNIQQFKISLDGKKVIFLSKAPDSAEELWIMNVDGTQKKQLFSSKFTITAQWSSDSKRIFFELRHPKAKKVEIYSIDIDTKQRRKLAEVDSDFCSQIFLPDDKGIIATYDKNTIWRMDMDGTNQHQIFPKPE